MLGATTGAAVKIMVIRDIRRAASFPDATSRTMARDNTIAAAAPIPCTNRAASIASISAGGGGHGCSDREDDHPDVQDGRRPRRSANSPAGIWPQAMPTMKMPTICWLRGRVVASASTIAGMAGRLRSTVNAATAVSRPSVMTKLLRWRRSVSRAGSVRYYGDPPA